MSYSTPTEITPVGSAEITASPVTAEAQNIALAAEQEATPTASGDADLFPLRPARDLTLKVCSSCHAPAIVAKQRLGEEEWSDLVQVMSARGAVATDKELSEILWSSIVGRLSVGYFADVFSKKSVMTATYFIVAATMLLLLHVSPKSPASLYIFAVGFGFSMGADYMLIPLMAAERFGINTLARAMSIILPVNTIGQTWCPYLVSALREHYGSYRNAMAVVVGIAMIGAVAIAALPRHSSLLEPGLSLRGEEVGHA